MYIYSKCAILCVFGGLSYGYPMSMVWVSYGKGCRMIGKWQYIGQMKACKHTGKITVFET